MGKWGKADFRQLEDFRKKLERMEREQARKFCEEAARELAARLLGKVIRRTPVGKYKGDEYQTKEGKTRYRNYKTVSFSAAGGKKVKFKSSVKGKNGGTLRRGWTAKTEEEARNGPKGDAAAYAQSMPVTCENGAYQIVVSNPVSYAPYVEFGHRTPGGKGWVEGQYMLTISEKELQAAAPGILEAKLEKFLKGMMA